MESTQEFKDDRRWWIPVFVLRRIRRQTFAPKVSPKPPSPTRPAQPDVTAVLPVIPQIDELERLQRALIDLRTMPIEPRDERELRGQIRRTLTIVDRILAKHPAPSPKPDIWLA